jgi:stearoyl-CoA desaturase (Delta-9 desaturase)
MKSSFWGSIIRWFDSDYHNEPLRENRTAEQKVDWVRCLPFIVLHAGCLGVFFTGASWFAVGAAIFLYFFRMFAITGFYHRYFSHRSFQTSRFGQFVFAVWGLTATQRGPLWWAYHHRDHHRHSDQPEDVHSAKQHGFFWSHIGWITNTANFPTNYNTVRDLARYPELVFLNRFDIFVPIAFATSLFGLGMLLENFAPGLGTNGPQMLVWAFFISTTCLFHGTCSINSLSHMFGNQRFKTGDYSRNNFFLSLVTLGEGWHNNHHYYMTSVRQGFYWWEVDITYYLLKAMSWTGFIWNLREVPPHVYAAAQGSVPLQESEEVVNASAIEPLPAK